MKKYLMISIVTLLLLIVCGCSKNNGSNPNNNQVANSNVFRYMKMSSANAGGLINIAYVFDEPSTVGHGDKTYNPTLVAEFDQVTGKAKNVTFYAFFLDNPDTSEWVDKAIEKFNTTSTSYKKDFSDLSKGRVNDFVTYLSVSMNPESHVFNQFIQMLLYKQDIEKYKDEIYYSRLSNYSTKPPVEEGSNYFEESLEGIRIEWSNNIISAY